MICAQAQAGEHEERAVLLRALLGAEGVITPDSLIDVCGLVELMLDPTKAHGERRRYGRPIAAALLRRYNACYGAPRVMFDGRLFYLLERLLVLAGEPDDGSQQPIATVGNQATGATGARVARGGTDHGIASRAGVPVAS